MISITRITTLSAVLSLGFTTILSAQSLATFGSAEIAGFGEGSALVGTSLSTGRQGWGPVATLVGQTYRYNNGGNTYAQAYAVSPSIAATETRGAHNRFSVAEMFNCTQIDDSYLNMEP